MNFICRPDPDSEEAPMDDARRELQPGGDPWRTGAKHGGQAGKIGLACFFAISSGRSKGLR